MAGASRDQPLGMGMLFYEDGTWTVTTFGVAKVEPPQDFAGMCALADTILPAHIAAALRPGEPIGDMAFHRYPTSRWRRYDKLDAFPAGIVPFGDAVASFNPTFGQGMTMTSLQAGQSASRRCEKPGDETWPRRLAQRDREDDLSGVDDERGRRLTLHGATGPSRGGTRRSAACSTSSSAPRRRIPFWPNGFCAASACSTACIWCRRRDWSAARSGTTCGCGWPSDGAANQTARDPDLVG